MTQRELNRAISRVTGETVSEIASIGFVPLTVFPHERDPEDMIVDWDQFDLERNVAIVEQPQFSFV